MPSHFQKGVFGLAHISISRGHHRTKSGFDSLSMTSETAGTVSVEGNPGIKEAPGTSPGVSSPICFP